MSPFASFLTTVAPLLFLDRLAPAFRHLPQIHRRTLSLDRRDALSAAAFSSGLATRLTHSSRRASSFRWMCQPSISTDMQPSRSRIISCVPHTNMMRSTIALPVLACCNVQGRSLSGASCLNVDRDALLMEGQARLLHTGSRKHPET